MIGAAFLTMSKHILHIMSLLSVKDYSLILWSMYTGVYPPAGLTMQTIHTSKMRRICTSCQAAETANMYTVSQKKQAKLFLL